MSLSDRSGTRTFGSGQDCYEPLYEKEKLDLIWLRQLEIIDRRFSEKKNTIESHSRMLSIQTGEMGYFKKWSYISVCQVCNWAKLTGLRTLGATCFYHGAGSRGRSEGEAKEPVGIEDNKYINVLFLIIHPSYNYKLCSPQCFKNICQNTVFKE